MSETLTFSCGYCNHHGDANDFMPSDYVALRCVNIAACQRRHKRNIILADMANMAKKPYAPVHPVDKFNFAAISICAGILAGTIIVCLLFLFGF